MSFIIGVVFVKKAKKRESFISNRLYKIYKIPPF